MNSTLKKFGYPESVIKSYEHWSVLLRPQQITLGSLILCSHSQVESFSEISTDGMDELQQIIKNIENSLTHCFNYDKINYLMLMMVDPHVHFHIFPRYGEAREFEGEKIIDTAWPGPPRLDQDLNLSNTLMNKLLSEIQTQWKQ